jgi:hypothetical protein
LADKLVQRATVTVTFEPKRTDLLFMLRSRVFRTKRRGAVRWPHLRRDDLEDRRHGCHSCRARPPFV